MLDIQNNKRQGSSGGLSSRPSQISLTRRDEGIIRRELNHSSSPPSNLRGMSADATERRSGSASPQPKPKSTALSTRRYGSADAEERWRAGASSQSKPTPNLRGMSADAAEKWSNSVNSQKPTPNLRGMSADAAERWSNAAKSRGSYTINSGDTLSAIAKRELGSSSRWREIRKADGSAFTESEAGRLQIGQRVHLPGTSGSSNNRASQPSNLRGMSANAAERWSTGSIPQPQLAIAPRREQNYNNALTRTNGVIEGTAVGAFVAERKLSYPIRTAPQVPENIPRASYNGYGYHTGQIAPNPGKRLTSQQRRNAWRAMVDDPKAPLTEVQRQQIRATPGKTSSAPTWRNPVTGNIERMELSHEPIPHRQGGQVVVPRWPEDHAARDPYRHLSRHVRDAYENQGDAIRKTFAEEVVVKEWGYKVNPSVLRGEKPPVVPPVSRASRAVSVLENSHVQRVARGASKVLAPIGVGLDTWRLGSAYKKDGFGEEFRQTAGSVAGGWGGAAAGAVGGAAIGSVVPVVGTAAGAIVGGIIGGVAGSEFGDDIEQGAEKAGQAIAGGAKKAWNELFG